MPTALSTTKRKFHRLLDTISSNASSTSLPPTLKNPSSASSTTLPVTSAPPAKRTRLDRPLSAYVPSSKPLRPETRPLPQAARLSAATSVSSSTPKNPPPNFAPWDRGQFLQRLKTYRHVDKWLGKPDSINEVEWAKRGWSCVRKETVRCVGGCEQEVVITLEGERLPQESDRQNEGEASATAAAAGVEDNPDQEESDEEWREEAQKELVKKYAEMISSAHEASCLWRRRGCDDTIHRLPLINQAAALEGLQQRYDSLNAMAAELPNTITTPEDLDVSSLLPIAQDFLQAHLKPPKALNDSSSHDPSTTESLPSSPPDINTSALLLALSGWHAEEDGHIPGLATCSACFRRLGLWLFKKPPSSPDEPDDAHVSSMEHLDVMSEHRDYCPWINAVSQNGHAREEGGARRSLDGLTGWEMQVRALRNWGAKQVEQGTSAKRQTKADGAAEVTSIEGDDRASVMSEMTNGLNAGQEEAERKKKDEERWAKLKRLRQVFFVKGKRKDGGDSRPATAT